MGETGEQIWEEAKALLVKEIPPANFAAWLSDARLAAVHDDTAVLQVPSIFAKTSIERRYRDTVERALAAVLQRPVELRLTVVEPEPPVRSDPQAARRYLGSLPLNPDYTFDTFVRGKNSQLAVAAAQAVAESPARAYNPLFIHGKVGLGKTHLLHAIGARVLYRPGDTTVVYTTSERFAIELIQAIGSNTQEQFRAKYRNVDVLLIDDIHFLKNKEGTQEELFHTFNELYGNGRQIVLSSDRPPEELHGLQDRLVSRFRWGLVADIQPPDFETRVAILREKAKRRDMVVPDAVVELIASRIRSNVRDLEGALIRALALQELGQGPLTPQRLEEILPKEDHAPRLTVEAIIDEVAAAYKVSAQELAGPSRKKEIVYPRQVAIFLARELTEHSFPALGRAFGGRDHTTIMHAYRKVQELMTHAPLLRGEIDTLRSSIQHKYGL